MKKSIIISAIALCASLVSVHATQTQFIIENQKTDVAIKVNSFCISIAKGDMETVKKLLELGEDVNQKSDGMTPAMYAAKYNRTDILMLLIAHGADLKVKSIKKMTALEYAQLHGAKDAYAIIEKALTEK
jgi:ankyrin repeat protein